jgi:hypothetical protein
LLLFVLLVACCAAVQACLLPHCVVAFVFSFMLGCFVGWWVVVLVACHSPFFCNRTPSPGTYHTMVFEVLIKFGFSKKINGW